MDRKTMLLIDGSGLIFRAFYAIRDLTNRDGLHTNGVYGFLLMYYKVMETLNPDYVCVAFDRKGKTFRHEDYEAYKATRDKAPDELSAQFGILKDILDAMNVAHTDLQGYEADDILGTLAKKAQADGMEVIIVTGDRDYLQLVDDHITVRLTRKGITEMEDFRPETIWDLYGVTPEQMIDVKGLMGDTSDNIPGVPGVGEKTALKYIKQYGSIEALYENLEDLKGKAKERLEDNKVQAFMSKDLGRIALNVPLDLTYEDLAVEEADTDQLRDRFERLDFKVFLEKLPESEKTFDDLGSAKWIEVLEWEDLAKVASIEKEMAITVLFDGEDYMRSHIAAFGIHLPHKRGSYISRVHDEGLFFETFKPLFESDTLIKLAYDLKPLVFASLRYGLNLKGLWKDAMIADYLSDPSRSKYTIQDASMRVMGLSFPDEVTVFGKGKSKKQVADIEDEILQNFIASPLAAIQGLQIALENRLEDLEMLVLYNEVEMPLVRVLAEMEFEGILVDAQMLKDLGDQFEETLTRIEAEIYVDAGHKFNINSPKQLAEILFEELGLPPMKKTKTGFSTDAEVLDKLKDVHPIVERILEYRTLAKLKSTYIDGLEAVIMEDGRVRTHFMQTVTATGRLSSVDPNLQNIPTRGEEGRKIRAAFIAKPGHVLVDADYSQIELRVLAHLSGDENMRKAFLDGLDIHQKTASEVNGVALDQVTPLMRYHAKAVNFGIVYGISDYGLSRDLDISRKEAKAYIDGYFDTFPGIKEYMETVVEQAKADGYVETVLHRRRMIPELQSKNRNLRGFGERIALNTPIQGTAADIIKIAMVRVQEKLKNGGYNARMILQVHDELMIEAPESEREEIQKILEETMASAIELAIPLKVDVQSGKSWIDAK